MGSEVDAASVSMVLAGELVPDDDSSRFRV